MKDLNDSHTLEMFPETLPAVLAQISDLWEETQLRKWCEERIMGEKL